MFAVPYFIKNSLLLVPVLCPARQYGMQEKADVVVIHLMSLPVKQSKYVIHLQLVNSNIFICNDPTFQLEKVFIILGRKTSAA